MVGINGYAVCVRTVSGIHIDDSIICFVEMIIGIADLCAIRSGAVDEYLQIIDLFFNQGIGEDLLHRVEGHRTVDSVLDAHKAKHLVSVVPGTVLHKILGQSEIDGASFHNWCVKDPVDILTVNAWAADGTIEGIENGSNILGVQFHPEMDDTLPEIFRFLTEE